jgi:hypothetical protein
MIDETQEEWRELGFYYVSDHDEKQWVLTGSRDGLLSFCDLLQMYVEEPRNSQLSEHDHYGPYKYLKIMTWSEAEVYERGIRGSLEDLLRLSNLVRYKLERAAVGEAIVISDEYAASCEYELCLIVRSDDFDPASPDPMEWANHVAES